ncbi:MAG TPA: hypothetical protein VKI61_02100 [Chitinophagaceae bacterium]|nr:hypothetical protein [Chitinophagaceae bacterium]
MIGKLYTVISNQKVNASNKGSLDNEIDLSSAKEHDVIFQKHHRFELLEILLKPQMNQESLPYELLKEHRLKQKKKKKKGLYL